jgi:HAMP domain-containing protein
MTRERVGKYLVRGVLGEGGMGTILAAWDPDLERPVAIKLVHRHRLDSDPARIRFAREARALARLSDPHVVQVHEFNPEGDEPWLVMELLQGRDLRSILDSDGPMTPARLRDCAWQITRGLAAAHAAGLIHRDIKPSNLMLCAGGVYKLLDFGLAEVGHSNLTDSGEVVGTRRYIAPERLDGAEATPASDLWALGVTLCELGTGRHPFPGKRIGGASEADPAAFPAGHHPTFIDWLKRLMARDPLARFADAGAALAALAPPALPATQTATGDPTRTMATASGVRVVVATQRPGASPSRQRLAQTRRPGLPFVVKLTAAIWLLSSAATLVAGLAISRHAVDKQVEALRRQLMGVAAGAAMLIDAAEHARLAAAPAPDDPALAVMRSQLQRYRQAYPEIRFIYTMARLPDSDRDDVVQFVCDASDETDRDHDGVVGPDECRAEPGQRYPAKDAPELIEGFTQPSADADVTTDQWGVWMSGYAPIRDATGTSVGLVGVDVPVDHLAQLRRDFLFHSGLLLGSTLLAFLAAGALIAWRMRRPVAELQRGMLAVAGGDFSVRVDIRTRDEFQVLAEAFDHMRRELQHGAELRVAFDAFVARGLAERQGRADAVNEAGGIRLACRVDGDTLPRILEAARTHGGAPERVVADGVVVLFPAGHPGDLPQERAVRAALAALAAGSIGTCGIAAEVETALDLARAGHHLGGDLLVTPQAFTPVADGFIADRLVERDDTTGRELRQVYAVKGAISA